MNESTPSPRPRPSGRDRANEQVQDFFHSTRGTMIAAGIVLIMAITLILSVLGL